MTDIKDINKISTNPKPVEMVYEIKDEKEYKVPSFEEFMKNYQEDENLNYADLGHSDIGDNKGYGPCKNALCGCSCSSYTCNCISASVSVGEWGPSVRVSGRMREEGADYTDKFMEGVTKDALKGVGRPVRGAGGQVSGSVFGYRDEGGDLKVLSGTAGGEVSSGTIKGRLSADLYNVKTNGIQARVGVAADTGISIEDGLEMKAVGFGFTVGKKMEISTPFFSVSKDTEDCVIQ